MDCSLPAFSIHGIFQARVPEWVAISFSRESSQPRDRTCFSHQADALPSKPRSIKVNFIPLLPSIFFFFLIMLLKMAVSTLLPSDFSRWESDFLPLKILKSGNLWNSVLIAVGLPNILRYSKNSTWHSDACCQGKYKLKLRSLSTYWKISESKGQVSPPPFLEYFKEM